MFERIDYANTLRYYLKVILICGFQSKFSFKRTHKKLN